MMVGIDKKVAILAVLTCAICAAVRAQAEMIVVWGNDTYGTVSGAPAGNDFKALAGAYAGGLALHADGSIADRRLGEHKQPWPASPKRSFYSYLGQRVWSGCLARGWLDRGLGLQRQWRS